jgi:hypothetical protein
MTDKRRSSRTEVLRSLSFGHRVAEDERDELAKYFIETDQWRRLSSGGIDVVYGAKGSGKSALYFLLLDRAKSFDRQGVILVAGENPRGTPAFQDLVADPPASEQEFIRLWKLYILSLVGRVLDDRKVDTPESRKVIEALRTAGLLQVTHNLKSLLKATIDYVRRISAVEGEIKLDPMSGAPSGVSSRIVFNEPSTKEVTSGVVSIDVLFQCADKALAESGLTVWILLDRLDVAFAETEELEQNALRALFKSYLDLQRFDHIRTKIFLRSDIWDRLTRVGFREASHITKHATIHWDRTSLLHLTVKRALQNDGLRQLYRADDSVMESTQRQEECFYRMFPAQVDVGPNKPRTLEWLLSRTRDGLGQTAPRELIHLLNSIRETQLRRFELGLGEPDGANLFSRAAIKDALPEVSKVRLQQTLYAEYPRLRTFLEKLRGEKTQHSPESLSTIWNTSEEKAASHARQLVEIGFFEERGSKADPVFWVPFLYRDGLEMVQGAASE